MVDHGVKTKYPVVCVLIDGLSHVSGVICCNGMFTQKWCLFTHSQAIQDVGLFCFSNFFKSIFS